MLWASNGIVKSTFIVILEGAVASVISMRPQPALLSLVHPEQAPLPHAAPPNVLFIEGSILSCGAHDGQLWKSLISPKIRSGGAWMSATR
jgi:hypothetical protein